MFLSSVLDWDDQELFLQHKQSLVCDICVEKYPSGEEVVWVDDVHALFKVS